jgi:hypothetical protein
MKTYDAVLLTIGLATGIYMALPVNICAASDLNLNLHYIPKTDHQFTITPEIVQEPPPIFILKPPKAPMIESEKKASFKKDKKSRKKVKNTLVQKIPFGDDLGDTWEFINGEVDIMGFENLRADRRNKGLQYTTNDLPLLGSVDGLDMRFAAGEDMEFSFTSDVTPFIGKIEGLSFKGAAGTDDNHISARYKIKFD